MNPKTRLRITTTRRPSTLVAETTTSPDYEYTDAYDTTTYYETTQAEQQSSTNSPWEDVDYFSRVTEEAFAPTLQTSEAEATTTARSLFDTETSVSTTTTEESDVHETADKHSTFSPLAVELLEAVAEAEEQNSLAEQDIAKPLDLDIQNEIIDQVFEESQNVQTAWNTVEEGDQEEDAEPTPVSRLSSYTKDIDTSKYDENEAKYEEEGDEVTTPQTVNEHGKQHHTVQHSDQWQPAVQASGFRPYVEIDRSTGKLVPSVESVEITEDFAEPDIIYDESKVGFGSNERDIYAVPVSVSFNLPQASTTTEEIPSTTTTEVVADTTTFRETTTPTTAFRDTSTIVYTTGKPIDTTTVREATTTTTYNEPITTEQALETTTTFQEVPTTTTTAEIVETTTFRETTAPPTVTTTVQVYKYKIYAFLIY